MTTVIHKFIVFSVAKAACATIALWATHALKFSTWKLIRTWRHTQGDMNETRLFHWWYTFNYYSKSIRYDLQNWAIWRIKLLIKRKGVQKIFFEHLANNNRKINDKLIYPIWSTNINIDIRTEKYYNYNILSLRNVETNVNGFFISENTRKLIGLSYF